MSRYLPLLTACLLSLNGAALAQTPGTPRILVGPNVLASRDGDIAHVELRIAANPRDARNLLGGARWC
ncbi:MAG: hypothetical protein ACREMA_03535 [Longimicrobiales bacterium]